MGLSPPSLTLASPDPESSRIALASRCDAFRGRGSARAEPGPAVAEPRIAQQGLAHAALQQRPSAQRPRSARSRWAAPVPRKPLPCPARFRGAQPAPGGASQPTRRTASPTRRWVAHSYTHAPPDSATPCIATPCQCSAHARLNRAPLCRRCARRRTASPGLRAAPRSVAKQSPRGAVPYSAPPAPCQVAPRPRNARASLREAQPTLSPRWGALRTSLVAPWLRRSTPTHGLAVPLPSPRQARPRIASPEPSDAPLCLLRALLGLCSAQPVAVLSATPRRAALLLHLHDAPSTSAQSPCLARLSPAFAMPCPAGLSATRAVPGLAKQGKRQAPRRGAGPCPAYAQQWHAAQSLRRARRRPCVAVPSAASAVPPQRIAPQCDAQPGRSPAAQCPCVAQIAGA